MADVRWTADNQSDSKPFVSGSRPSPLAMNLRCSWFLTRMEQLHNVSRFTVASSMFTLGYELSRGVKNNKYRMTLFWWLRARLIWFEACISNEEFPGQDFEIHSESGLETKYQKNIEVQLKMQNKQNRPKNRFTARHILNWVQRELRGTVSSIVRHTLVTSQNSNWPGSIRIFKSNMSFCLLRFSVEVMIDAK